MTQKEFDSIYKKLQTAYQREMSYWKNDEAYKYGLADAFKNCDAEMFAKAVQRHIDTSAKAPTIANLRERINGLQRERPKQQTYETVSCKKCGGVGLISYYRWSPAFQYWYEYLCHCDCKNNEKFKGNTAFWTEEQVNDLIRNNPFVRLNVPIDMRAVPPDQFEERLKARKSA